MFRNNLKNVLTWILFKKKQQKKQQRKTDFFCTGSCPVVLFCHFTVHLVQHHFSSCYKYRIIDYSSFKMKRVILSRTEFKTSTTENWAKIKEADPPVALFLNSKQVWPSLTKVNTANLPLMCNYQAIFCSTNGWTTLLIKFLGVLLLSSQMGGGPKKQHAIQSASIADQAKSSSYVTGSAFQVGSWGRLTPHGLNTDPLWTFQGWHAGYLLADKQSCLILSMHCRRWRWTLCEFIVSGCFCHRFETTPRCCDLSHIQPPHDSCWGSICCQCKNTDLWVSD